MGGGEMAGLTYEPKRVREAMHGYDRMRDENAKLRRLVDGLLYCAHEAHGMCARTPVGGGEPFECCPLYDFEKREYGCKTLMEELGVSKS